MSHDINVTPPKRVLCIHCNKVKGVHNAMTKACPIGFKGRIGYTSYSSKTVFTPKL